MSPEWISASSSAVSVVIIALSAFTATRQFAHFRIANQSQTYIALATLLQSPEVRTSAQYILDGHLDAACDDLGAAPTDVQLANVIEPALPLLHVLETVGACVLHRMLDYRLVVGTFSPVPFWRQSERFIELVRHITGNPNSFDNFEALTALIEKHGDRPLPKVARSATLRRQAFARRDLNGSHPVAS